MKRSWQKNRRTLRARLLADDRAAQIVEFAVTLPLLIVFVVGIFDFSSAFTLKQKLTNVARDAARAAAADPVTDLQTSKPTPLPVSVSDAFQVINNYFTTNGMNNCGLPQGISKTGPVGWIFTGTTSCPPGGITIIINRGYYFPADGTAKPPDVSCTPQSAGGSTMAVLSTCVSIQYAYQWQFGRVASLLGSSTTLPPSITATAVAMNEN